MKNDRADFAGRRKRERVNHRPAEVAAGDVRRRTVEIPEKSDERRIFRDGNFVVPEDDYQLRRRQRLFAGPKRITNCAADYLNGKNVKERYYYYANVPEMYFRREYFSTTIHPALSVTP